MGNNITDFKKKLFADLTIIPEALNQKHLPTLDGMRGISVLMVISGHLLLGTSYNTYDEGGIGVGIFFVISGFLITTLLLKEKVNTGAISLKNFYIRRALRILPVAYLYLVVLKLLTFVISFKISTIGLVAAAFYLMNFPVAPYEWSVYHFWTLSIEEQFYLIFPIILVFSLNRYSLITFALIIIMPFINFLGFSKIGMFYTNHTVHIITFVIIHLLGMGTVSILVGSLFAVLVFKNIIVIEKLKSGYFLSFIVFLVAAAIRMQPIVSYAYNLFPVIFSILIGYVILINLKGSNFFTRILNYPPLTKIGVLSYSLYIWQQIFTNFRPWAHSFRYSDSTLLNMIALCTVAYFSYYFYEKKFLLLKAKFKKT